jgi:hypothetical protein
MDLAYPERRNFMTKKSDWILKKFQIAESMMTIALAGDPPAMWPQICET